MTEFFPFQLTIWGLLPIGEYPDDPPEAVEDDDSRWRKTHGLNERGEFEGWQPEDLRHA